MRGPLLSSWGWYFGRVLFSWSQTTSAAQHYLIESYYSKTHLSIPSRDQPLPRTFQHWFFSWPQLWRGDSPREKPLIRISARPNAYNRAYGRSTCGHTFAILVRVLDIFSRTFLPKMYPPRMVSPPLNKRCYMLGADVVNRWHSNTCWG